MYVSFYFRSKDYFNCDLINLNAYVKVELLNHDENRKQLINAYAHHVRNDPTGKKLIEKYSRRSRVHNNNESNADDITNTPVKSEHRWEATFSQQISILTERAFKQSRKDILSTINLFQNIAMCLIGCILWLQLPYVEANIGDRAGSVSMNNIFCVYF